MKKNCTKHQFDSLIFLFFYRESSADHLHSRESLDSSLSQAGDIDVDVVDGDLSGLSISSATVSSLLEPVELASKALISVYSQDKQYNQLSLDLALTNGTRDLAGAAMTLCCGTGSAEDEDNPKQPKCKRQETAQPKPSEGCLLRLFESQVFDMSMAISYLFNSKEPGVQSYLGEFKLSFLLQL